MRESEKIKSQPALWKRLLLPVQEGEERWLRFFRIFIGNILLTGAYAFITVPKIILNGGVTSFSLVLEAWTPWSVALWVDVLTILLIIISYIFLGKSYFVGALFSSVCYMVLFNVFHWTGLELPVPTVFWHADSCNTDCRLIGCGWLLFLYQCEGHGSEL